MKKHALDRLRKDFRWLGKICKEIGVSSLENVDDIQVRVVDDILRSRRSQISFNPRALRVSSYSTHFYAVEKGVIGQLSYYKNASQSNSHQSAETVGEWMASLPATKYVIETHAMGTIIGMSDSGPTRIIIHKVKSS